MNGETTAVAIGLLSVSDRASAGEYEDRGVPAMREWLQKTLSSPWRSREAVVADDFAAICAILKTMIDEDGCRLVLTSGGTGPAPRDVTPEATRAVADREIPGFGEEMRRVNLRYAPTAILSRQIAASRGRALIVNLPGQPKAVGETLDGIFSAVPYCMELLGAPGLCTNPEVLAAFRPKSAR
ncbi:MAG: molybdopterin adenylyltransferase [Gammaproteobacteria bacterium]